MLQASSGDLRVREPQLAQACQAGQRGQALIGDRRPVQVQLLKAGQSCQVPDAEVPDLGRSELQLSQVLQALQISEQLIGHARRGQRDFPQLAVLDHRVAADRTHPSGHGPVPLAGHDPVRPFGEAWPYRGVQEAHLASRHRGPQAIHTGPGHPRVAQIDDVQMLEVLEHLHAHVGDLGPVQVQLFEFRHVRQVPDSLVRQRGPLQVQLLQLRHPPQVGDPGIRDPRPTQVQMLDVHQAAETPQSLVADHGIPQQEPAQLGEALHLPQALVVHGAIDQVERLEIRERGQMTTSHLGILQAQQPETRCERRDGFDPRVLELDRFEIGVAEGQLLERTNAREVAQLAAVIDARPCAGIPHGSGEVQGLQSRQPAQPLQIGGIDVGAHEVRQLEMKVGRPAASSALECAHPAPRGGPNRPSGSPIRQPADPAARPATVTTPGTVRARPRPAGSRDEPGRQETSRSWGRS